MFPRLLLCAAALTSVGVSACAGDQDSDADGIDAEDEDLQELASVQGASGVRFASVTANGTGCPRGSWRASVSPNGDSISLRFSSLGGETSRRRSLVVKDCNLAIKLNSVDNVSYALVDARTSGSAYLREGATLSLTSKAYWQGNPAQGTEQSLSLRGQYRDDFSIGEAIPEAARVWSPCGVQRDLNIVTRARLQAPANSYGSFEISRLGDVKIAVRSCGAEPDAGPGEPDAGPGEPDAGPGEPDAGPGEPDAGPDSSVPPSGLAITSVVTNGTGCPSGSATATITPDGQNFSLAFSQFSGAVDANGAFAIKDCNLAVAVANPDGQAFAVDTFGFRGNAELGAGANLALTSNYYFQGNPSAANSKTTTLTGPYSQAFDVTDQIGDDAVYAPCGVTRDLNIVLRARLQNGTPRTANNFSVASAGPIKFKLRACPTN